MLKFTLPNKEHREDVLSFYKEFEDNKETCIGYGNSNNFDDWLTGMGNRLTGKNLPEGWVRENFYLCYDGNELVGVFSLKLELTEYLLNFGGHIGYATRPSKRKRGYATKMLRQGLTIAKELGFERVLCFCDDDNYASEMAIQRNGGVLENTLFDTDENVLVKRYWITL